MKSRISRIAQGEPYLADSCGALATTPAGYVWTVRICMDCSDMYGLFGYVWTVRIWMDCSDMYELFGYVWTVRICMDCWGIDMNAKAVVTTTDGEVRTLAVTVASKRKNTYMSPRRKTLHFFY